MDDNLKGLIAFIVIMVTCNSGFGISLFNQESDLVVGIGAALMIIGTIVFYWMAFYFSSND